MIRLGIDLGTSQSVASYVNARGVPILVPDARCIQDFRTPSVVHIDGALAQVGHPVEALLLDEPDLRMARGFKLHMGTGQTVLDDRQRRAWSPEALSALILRKLLDDVEAAVAEIPASVTIGVPANFGPAQRAATRAAGRLAGINQVSLVDEPVAAAHFFGLDERSPDQTVLVYDFGGGTFDATVIQIAEGRLYVLATDGNNRLGGQRIDERLIDLIARDYQRAHGGNPLADPAAREQMRRGAEAIKLALFAGPSAHVRKNLVVAGHVLEYAFTRDQLEHLAAPLVDETLAACRCCLIGAGLHWSLIDRILVTGGSAQAPYVLRRLAAESGHRIDTLRNDQPFHAVAYGAALVAHARGEPDQAEHRHAVAPYHLGLRVRDPLTGQSRIQILVKRNTPLPARHTAVFYTTRDDQTRLILDVVQSKDGIEVCESLGHFAFGSIAKPRRNYPVEIHIGYDCEGLITLTARDPQSGQSLERELLAGEDTTGATLHRQQELLAQVRLVG